MVAGPAVGARPTYRCRFRKISLRLKLLVFTAQPFALDDKLVGGFASPVRPLGHDSQKVGIAALDHDAVCAPMGQKANW